MDPVMTGRSRGFMSGRSRGKNGPDSPLPWAWHALRRHVPKDWGYNVTDVEARSIPDNGICRQPPGKSREPASWFRCRRTLRCVSADV
jgi:hypothetical protein